MYVRVRPPSDDERQAKSRTVVSVTPGHPDREVEVQEKGTKRKFNYDRVFDDISKQKDVFQCVAKPLIDQVRFKLELAASYEKKLPKFQELLIRKKDGPSRKFIGTE